MELTGKVAIVTGGGQGLGEATARALARAGITVICADIQTDKAQKVADSINANGGKATSLLLDVTQEESVKQAVETVRKQYGRIDILINNAGTDVTVPFTELTVEQWDRIQQVNLRGPFLMCKYVLPIMYEQHSGHVVNVGSTAAKRMWANAAGYHASKWGLVGLSHALYVEARECNVKVTIVIAGGMRTPFILDRFPGTDPNKLQDPAQVANTILFVLQQPLETIIPEVMVLPLHETSWP
ncbi:MAG: SDR family oxidoreductase [Anaerolineae bacterium]|nr:SDR family oxidoreductase [Anaerolineae bacterium]